MASIFANTYAKAENMKGEFARVRLESLNRKMMAGIMTPREMLERELLAAAA